MPFMDRSNVHTFHSAVKVVDDESVWRAEEHRRQQIQKLIEAGYQPGMGWCDPGQFRRTAGPRIKIVG